MSLFIKWLIFFYISAIYINFNFCEEVSIFDYFAKDILGENGLEVLNGDNLNKGRSMTRNVSELNVGIIGSGITGLYTALILDSLGIKYEILEANPSRVGGLLYTYYFDNDYPEHISPLLGGKQKWSIPFAKKFTNVFKKTKKQEKTKRKNTRKSESQCYANNFIDLGGMRIPKLEIMERLMGKHKWSLINYINDRVDKEELKIKTLDTNFKKTDLIYYFNNRKVMKSELNNNKDLLGFSKENGGAIPSYFAERSANYWVEKVFDPLNFIVNITFGNYSYGEESLKKLDIHSARTYLLSENGPNYPPEVVDWLESVTSSSGSMNSALVDFIKVHYLYNVDKNVDFVYIKGGIINLLNSMLYLLKNKPILNQKVKEIEPDGKSMKVKTISSSKSYSHVISTMQFNSLRYVNLEKCEISYHKRTAIRLLHQQNAIKIGLLFNFRSWQKDKLMNGKPNFGGISMTDLPIRQVIFPYGELNCTDEKAVLMASYVQANDADKLSSLNDQDLMNLVLKNLETLYGKKFLKAYTGKYVIKRWSQDPYALGAYNDFDPGEFKAYYPHLIEPEVNGKLYFAGESTSAYHGWIIGALNSGYRTVKQILKREGLEEKLKQMRTIWGEFSFF